MKTFTLDDIRSWRPCYDPSRHLPEDWQGTVLDILKHDTIPPQDRLWVVLREELIDSKTLRLFAVRCARQVQHLMTDTRSIAVLEVAERHARGDATDEELRTARCAARDAWDAARDAAGAARAACDAAFAPARYAALGNARTAQVVKLIEMLEEEES